MDVGGRSSFDKVGPNDSGPITNPAGGKDEALVKSNNPAKSRRVSTQGS